MTKFSHKQSQQTKALYAKASRWHFHMSFIITKIGFYDIYMNLTSANKSQENRLEKKIQP